MERLLLIAEKPSLMRDLKDTYFNHRREIPYNIDFVALSGHICCYANPKEYPEWDKKWEELSIPMIPKKWTINVMDNKKDVFKNIEQKIKENSYDGLICATDADREGNLIFHLLASKMNANKLKTYRIWIHDQTDKGLFSAYKNMVDFNKDIFQRNLTLASVLRSRFDWIIGMNVTVAASLKFKSLTKIGRVKSPTLKLVYDNSMAIKNFEPKTSFYVVCNLDNGITATLLDENNKIKEFETKEKAQEFIQQLKGKAVVKSLKKETAKTNPKQLYKLSDIQIDASKLYGYSPARTLELIQSLYEVHKLVSYPRCDCNYISSSIIDEATTILNNVSAIKEYERIVAAIQEEEINRVRASRRYVNDKEVNKSSHTALIPTANSADLSKLSPDELNILNLIYKRFVSIFLPPLVEEKSTVLLENNGYLFRVEGRVVVDKGFTNFFPEKRDDVIIPPLKEGEVLSVKSFDAKGKTTTPPARLTDGTLIQEMISIGKNIDDDVLKKISNETKGIGTQATRAAIISELIKDDYIICKKSQKSNTLYISPKGRAYVENLKDTKIIDPSLTAEWEKRLKEVETGERDAVSFNNDMMKFLNVILSDIKSISNVQTVQKLPKNSLGKCPRCGKDIIEGKKSFGCLGYKDDPKCTFSIWKDNAFFKSQGKKLTPSIVSALLSNKDHRVLVKGFRSKSGNKYNAYISLVDGGGNFVNLDVEFDKKK